MPRDAINQLLYLTLVKRNALTRSIGTRPPTLYTDTATGMWAELANDILELGKYAVSDTGGLISVAEIVLKLNKTRPGKLIPPKDVIRALDNLVETSLISPLRKLASGVMIAEFVSIELSADQEAVFNLASRKGFLTQEIMLIQLGWSAERSNRVLNELVKEGIAIKDESYQEGMKFLFPSLG